MVASVAAGWTDDLFAALDRMAPRQRVIPADEHWRSPHDLAYRIYLKLFNLRNEVEANSKAIDAAPDWAQNEPTTA